MFEFLFKSKCHSKTQTRMNTAKNTAIKTSNESHLYFRKKTFLGIHFIFGFSDFEADNAVNFFNKACEKIFFSKQTPLCNGYYKVSKLKDLS